MYQTECCAKPMTQLLSNLPPGWVAAHEAAFTHTGIDYFGPFHVSTPQHNHTQKIWGGYSLALPHVQFTWI